MSARETVAYNRNIIPVNGSANGPFLDFSLLLATRAPICVERCPPRIVLLFSFLSQYHPHDELRIWPSTFLEPNFVGHLDHFVTCVHTEVVHLLVNKTDESAIFCGFFVYKEEPYGSFELLDEDVNARL